MVIEAIEKSQKGQGLRKHSPYENFTENQALF